MSGLQARRESRRFAAVPDWARPVAFDNARTQALLLFAAAFLIRVWQFGNPVIHVDEQFYLLVGDRMLQGDLPYVDIWDRKPIGLFLIYAAIRLLGGDGVLYYQVAATLCAGATALVIARIAMRAASGFGAVSAGIAYLCWLMLFGGDGGQSPVFYNLLVAGAALLTLKVATLPGPQPIARIVRAGAAIMLIAGIAIQVKYTVLFEGMFFGLMLLWTLRQHCGSLATLAGAGMLWIGVALAPTAAAWAWYVAIGQGEAFFFANFVSIFGRPPSEFRDLLSRLSEMALYSFPLWICAVVSLRGRFDAGAALPTPGGKAFIAAWLAAATLGLLLFGSYYDHYFLPVLVPLTAMIAPLVGAPGTGLNLFRVNREQIVTPVIVLLAIMALIAAKITLYENIKGRGDGGEIDRIAQVVKPRLNGGCMLVFDIEPILYYKTGSCFNSPYVFAPHLSSFWENNAAGVNTLAEVRRIMAAKPPIVVTSKDIEEQPNLATWRFMQAALRRDYTPIYAERIGYGTRLVYERKAH